MRAPNAGLHWTSPDLEPLRLLCEARPLVHKATAGEATPLIARFAMGSRQLFAGQDLLANGNCRT